MVKYFLWVLLLISCKERIDNKDQLEGKIFIDGTTLNKEKSVNIDSLYQLVVRSKNDTLKVNNLISIFKLSIKNKPIRDDILDEALIISKSLDYQTGIANCLSKKGVNARYEHHYLRSLKFHKEALPYYRNSWDIRSRIKNLNSLGVTYRRLNIEEEAIRHHLKALKLSEKIDFSRSIAIALNGIGNAYVTLDKYDEAIKYFNLSLKMNLLDKNVRGTGYDYSNLGEVYMYKKQYDTAFYYHYKSLEVANKSKYKNDKAIINSAIGLMYQHKGDLNKALDYYNKSIPTLEYHNSKRLLSFTLINLGIVYKELDKYKEAKEYIISGLQLSKEISSKENIVLGYEALSELLELTGKYKNALGEFKLMTIYRDSIFNIQSENNIMAMNIKYDSEKKDEKIKRLNLESKVNKNQNIILFLAIGFLLLLGVFYTTFNRMRLKNNNLQIDNMRHQIGEYLEQISKYKERDKEDKKDGFLVKIKEYGLSERESEVLMFISQGMKNQEIADRMFVSLSTIKTHTKNIFDKLDVRNRIEAARKAQVF